MNEGWDVIEMLLAEMVAQQEVTVLALGRTLAPNVTPEDLRNPQDIPAIATSATFNYEDGILTGLRSARIAMRARRNHEAESNQHR